VALALIAAIGARWGVAVGEPILRAGLAAARWPGRLEVLDGTRLGVGRVLLDGAHNPAGATALASALRELDVHGPTIVFAATRGKDVGGILRALAPLAPRFVFTRFDDPGALDPGQLAATWRRLGGRGRIATTPAEALRTADTDPIVVAGSLYLVGEIRGMITASAEDD
jgi:dihydrofolate synthase / folylpolyglutamate synthase